MASITKNEPACSRPLEELIRERAPLAALQRYPIERGHARQTVYGYLDRAGHFCHWAERTKLDLGRTDEKVVARFCDDHLAHCDCGWPTHTDPREASAALGHLLLVLRVLGVAGPSAERGTLVDEELHRFDEHMDQVRGLAASSRTTILRVVRELLWGRFHERPVVISAITPEYLRRFVAKLTERYHGPASVGAVISALRGYFRFRAEALSKMSPPLLVKSSPQDLTILSEQKKYSRVDRVDTDVVTRCRTSAVGTMNA